MIKSAIVGSNKNRESEVIAGRLTSPNGVMTYTEPYKIWQNNYKRFFGNNFGSNLAINTLPQGDDELIHNGNDTTAWTATDETQGTWDFSSTAQVYEGTQSIDGTGTVNNSQALFTAPSPVNSNDYDVFQFAIYIDNVSGQLTGKEINLQFRLAGALVGDELPVSDYVDYTNTGNWILINIDITDFNLTGDIDELLITVVDTGPGGAINFYLDKINLIATTGGNGKPETYSIQPSSDEYLKVHAIEWIITDNVDSSNLVEDQILGVSELDSPILFRVIYRNQTILVYNISNLFDFLSFPGSTISAQISTSNSTTIKIRFDFSDPFIFNPDSNDRIEIVVSDNLSALTKFECSAEVATSVTNDEKFDNSNL